MKKFFADFKKFISRGNIIDMAVGVIIGGAFSAIVTALTNKIIMPLINYLLSFGGNGLESAFTFLRKAYDVNGELDLTKSIYIDWGAFITAIIDFLLIAFTLFIILKVAMKSSEMFKHATDAVKGNLSKEDKAELKNRGIKRTDKVAVNAYLAEKAQLEAEAKAAAEAEAAEKAKAERLANPTTEDLLKEIRNILAEGKTTKAEPKTTVKKSTKTASKK